MGGWTVRDDIWTETVGPDGEKVREHSYGEPYIMQMSESDQSLYQAVTIAAVVVVIGIIVAVIGMVIA